MEDVSPLVNNFFDAAFLINIVLLLYIMYYLESSFKGSTVAYTIN